MLRIFLCSVKTISNNHGRQLHIHTLRSRIPDRLDGEIAFGRKNLQTLARDRQCCNGFVEGGSLLVPDSFDAWVTPVSMSVDDCSAIVLRGRKLRIPHVGRIVGISSIFSLGFGCIGELAESSIIGVHNSGLDVLCSTQNKTDICTARERILKIYEQF